jgi:hypothetical protein
MTRAESNGNAPLTAGLDWQLAELRRTQTTFWRLL